MKKTLLFKKRLIWFFRIAILTLLLSLFIILIISNLTPLENNDIIKELVVVNDEFLRCCAHKRGGIGLDLSVIRYDYFIFYTIIFSSLSLKILVKLLIYNIKLVFLTILSLIFIISLLSNFLEKHSLNWGYKGKFSEVMVNKLEFYRYICITIIVNRSKIVVHIIGFIVVGILIRLFVKTNLVNILVVNSSNEMSNIIILLLSIPIINYLLNISLKRFQNQKITWL